MTERMEHAIDVHGAHDAAFDPDALQHAFQLLSSWVDDGILPGAAALVARHGRVAGEAYLGLAHRAQQRPVDPDTIWSLASVTKPFTATTVMLLVERGLISLDEPIFRYIPEFLRAPTTPFDRRHVTLRHVLAHCSGLPGFSEDNFALRQEHRPLEDFVGSFMRQPLLFAPGTAHYYSNPGILMAAETVGRALTGTLGEELETPAVRKLHGFVAESILDPLGMTSSGFCPPEAWDSHIAWVERTGQEGKDWEMSNSAYYRGLGIPWGGMYSTPRDLARFVDIFLPDAQGLQRLGLATLSSVHPRVVSPATARAMISVQFAPPDAPSDLAPELRDSAAQNPPRTAVSWGIGWDVKGTKRGHPSGDLTSSATYGHLGASGTMVWADPQTDIVCVLLTNRTLASGWSTERPRQALFSNAVMAAAR